MPKAAAPPPPRRRRRAGGKRLADPRDPAVQRALERSCPICDVAWGEWCIGKTEGGRTWTRTRIHFARATFVEYGPDGQPK